MRPGFVLDIGCGIGRNLGHLNGHGVGVDHNPTSVAACVSAGLTAFSPGDFEQSRYAASDTFDTVLLAHVIEHMTESEAHDLVSTYVAYLRPGGRVILITPQERGQASDSTHVRFIDHTAVHGLAGQLGLDVVALRSFPLPRVAGRVFTYNETVAVLA
jgi:2-polyprenyl-3-methyl-5-hydroxy-6-metoxy-1,4-benzoquinol methylase